MGFFGPPNVDRMEDERDIEGLRKALKDKDKYIRSKAAGALARIGGKRLIEPWTIEPWIIEPLIEALKDEDWEVRSAVAGNLSYLRNAKFIKPLVEALKDEHRRVRIEAANTLGSFQYISALKPLIEALKDEDSEVRKNAAQALGYLEDTRAEKPLKEALKDESEEVREEASYALKEYILKTKEKPVSGSMLYLWVIGQNRKPSKKLLNEVLSHYGGEGVVMLGGHETTTLPKEPDMYVVTVCLKACKENNIDFDSDRDEIAYSIDNINGEEIGVCKIRVHTG